MKFGFAALVAAGALGMAGAASAHHSFAMFDSQKTLSLDGTVKDFQWTNPHTWVELVVRDASGKENEWAIEGGSPNALARTGWKRTVLKPGDRAVLVIHPLKDGTHGGSYVSITLPSGQVLGQQRAPG